MASKRKVKSRAASRPHWMWEIGRVADADRGDVQERLRRMERQLLRLARPEVELELEEFAPLLAEFRHLQRAGVDLHPALAILLDKLAAQAFGSPADGDCEYDDPDYDGEDIDAEPDDPPDDSDDCDTEQEHRDDFAGDARDDPNAGWHEGPMGGIAVSS